MTAQTENRTEAPEQDLKARPKGIVAFWRSSFVRWLLLVAAVFFASAWFASLVPYKPEWGDIATWIGAIATGGGLIFAGTQIRHQLHQREDEMRVRKEQDKLRREKDARAVGIKSEWVQQSSSARPAPPGQGTHFVDVTIQNKSENPITKVSIAAWDITEGSDWLDLAPVEFDRELGEAVANGQATRRHDTLVQHYVGTFMADEKVTYRLQIDHPLAGPEGSVGSGPLVLVSFTDTWGQDWMNNDVTGWRVNN